MHSTTCATIDASVLAIPIKDDREEVCNYIEKISKLGILVEEKWISLFLSENIGDVLFSSGLFPGNDELSRLLISNEINEYSSRDIFKVILKLLSIQPYFECNYRISNFESGTIETDPSVSEIIDSSILQNELLKSATLIAILNKHCSNFLGQHWLFLRKAPKGTIQVRAEIKNIEHDRDDVTDIAISPIFFNGNAFICDEISELIKTIDACSELANANDKDSLLFSIRVALFKSQFNDTQCQRYCWDEIKGPKIGPEFLKRCKKICEDRESSMPSKILDAIIETVNRTNLSCVHALRTGEGASDTQRKRGKDKAWRRDVDDEIHLHYWKCGNGEIELASVNYHNDFTIPE